MAPQDKAALRARVLAARRAVPEAVHAAEAHALADHVTSRARAGDVVAAYVPLRGEPADISMLDALRARRVTVLLPVVRDGDGSPLPLGWGVYRGEERLLRRRFGLREPRDGIEGAAALATATLVLVPALAVDRAGVRLGRGGGYYDRSLGFCGTGTPRVAVVRDDELVASLPAQPHDVPVSHALTPRAGLVALGR